MDIYVVSNVWWRDGATVIGAGAARSDAEAIADRADTDDARAKSWASWRQVGEKWIRDALMADGTTHASLYQEIVCVPLAGVERGGVVGLGEMIVARRDWPIYRDPLPPVEPTSNLLTMTTAMDRWRDLINKTVQAQFAGPLRCGSGEAWRWVESRLEAVAAETGLRPNPEALPVSVAARFAGVDIVLDPDLPPNVMRIGPKIYVVNGETIYETDESHWPGLYFFTSPLGSDPAAD